MLEQGASSRECIAATGADSTEPVVGLDHVAISGEEECGFAVGNDEQRFQVAERAVLAPFLGQLDGGFLQIAGMLLELALKALEERDGVRGRACKARDDF